MSCGSGDLDDYAGAIGTTDGHEDELPGQSRLARVVDVACRQLGLDAAAVVEVLEDGEDRIASAGEPSLFGWDGKRSTQGPGVCHALLSGRLPHVVRDALHGPESEQLRRFMAAPVGAFIGVPLRLSDGGAFGALIGLSAHPRPDLDERDERFLATLGDVLVTDLARLHADRLQITGITGILEREHAQVAFQPVVDLANGRCLGIEALARFPEPFERPDVTFAAANRLGLGLELERLVIRQAWRIIPSLGRSQFLALNLSPDALVELARRANLRDDLPLYQLVVEVTEHSFIDRYEPLLRQLGPLREKGLRLAVDDAGAGYASLRHILELRPDFIKIDRALTDGMAGDRAKRVAVGAFRSLANDLRASVVAEGVERLEDLEVASELGIQAAQGYLLGRPATERQTIERWLRPSWRAEILAPPAPERRVPASSGAAVGAAGARPAPPAPTQRAKRPTREVSSEWRREHAGSGVTSRLILEYVAREAGGNAVRQLLERAALTDAEQSLRDENSWFSYETKLALWAAAEDVLADPRVALHVGEAVLDISVATGLKRTLRALGTPGFVYGNVVRANAKFNWAHELVVTERGSDFVMMRYTDVAGVGYHHYDCDYTQGLLSTVPELFGLPKASVEHRVCGALNDRWCEFEVRWTPGLHNLRRSALLVGVASAALLGAGAAAPLLLPAGAALLLGGEAALAVRGVRLMHRRLHVLEQRVGEQDDAAQRLLSSLEDLSSDLRLDEVLDQITDKARSAVGGKEFALLLDEGECMRANRHSRIPAPALTALERWAHAHRAELRQRGPVVVDDLAIDPLLAYLPAQERMPIGSMCAAPLLFRDELLGVLVALAHGSTVFLPGDAAALAAYATHAAIALSNARLVERLERQAAEDPLTGLVNQRAFWDACTIEFSRAERAGESVSIVVLDLDRFKMINDEHGHPYGDQVLVAVAGALRSAVRSHDTVARLGGEEFALLLPDTAAEEAHELAERARRAIAGLPVLTGPLSGSAGAATAMPDEVSPQQLLEGADRALYQAKRRGRDRTVSSRDGTVARLAARQRASAGRA